MNLRTLTIIFTLLTTTVCLYPQEISRSQIESFPLRKDAEARDQSNNPNYIPLEPRIVMQGEVVSAAQQSFSVPQSWVDASVYLHLEQPKDPYTLWVNGNCVATCSDSLSPADYDISAYVRVGENLLSLVFDGDGHSPLEESITHPSRERFADSYIYTQRRLKILDYSLSLSKISDGVDGKLLIDVIVENGFNYEESIEVGFDIYSPAGELLDFSSAVRPVAGGSIDTLRFTTHLYGANKHRWNPSSSTTSQPLYKLMIFTKRNRISSDYIPIEVPFITPEYSEGELFDDGAKIVIKSRSYSAMGDKQLTESELRAIKREGYNTIIPHYPQPIWFYSLCNKIGLYVIEQVAISAPSKAADRTLGGNPSNDPQLLDEYLARVKRAYYRTRNFNCVVAYSLGSEAGNGYNMYKAYQWLKSVEQQRPVLYRGANGEWNSDLLEW